MKLPAIMICMALALATCTNQPKVTNPDISAILKHSYWVSKNFNDALFATNIIDTLPYLPCSELIFEKKDTLVMTACQSDAGMGVYKATGPNTLEIRFEGSEDQPTTARYDEKTGILHLSTPPGQIGWPTEFVAHDDINVSNIDNVTIQLGRKRLAGQYSVLPQPGQAAVTSLVEIRADGTHTGLGDFDLIEPWIAGIGGSFLNDPVNLMYLVKKGKENEAPAAGWQMRGDTLRIWDSKNVNAEGDMPEYQRTGLRGTYVKVKK
jgi:hypothetical protein